MASVSAKSAELMIDNWMAELILSGVRMMMLTVMMRRVRMMMLF